MISEPRLQLDAPSASVHLQALWSIAVARTRWDVLYSAMLLASVACIRRALALGKLEDILAMPVSQEVLNADAPG
jgi:hypothetical protein